MDYTNQRKEYKTIIIKYFQTMINNSAFYLFFLNFSNQVSALKLAKFEIDINYQNFDLILLRNLLYTFSLWYFFREKFTYFH